MMDVHTPLHGFTARRPSVSKEDLVAAASSALSLFVFLALNLTTVYIYYTLNFTPPTLVSEEYLRWGLNSSLIPILGISIFGCAVAFGGLLCLHHTDRAFCVARAGLGCVLGALAVVNYGVWNDVFVGEGVLNLIFWAMTGMVPGAGVTALVGFVYDCLVWGWEPEDDEEMVPLLEKEVV